ncbi:MAG: hypothetical protein HYS98_03675 [Deltaproteobacteria bacterium]|nr:hypothetical protein [Deltaproteobacteria bacterium]
MDIYFPRCVGCGLVFLHSMALYIPTSRRLVRTLVLGCLLLLNSCATDRSPAQIPSSKRSAIESFDLTWHDFKISIDTSKLSMTSFKKAQIKIRSTDALHKEVFLYRDSFPTSQQIVFYNQPELELKNGVYFVDIEITDLRKKLLFKEKIKREIFDSPLQ